MKKFSLYRATIYCGLVPCHVSSQACAYQTQAQSDGTSYSTFSSVPDALARLVVIRTSSTLPISPWESSPQVPLWPPS